MNFSKTNAGSIWKARHLELHCWVAVKFIRFEAKGFLERFVREARVAGSFKHPLEIVAAQFLDQCRRVLMPQHQRKHGRRPYPISLLN